jgi:plastocyanin
MGWVARNWRSPPHVNLGKTGVSRKAETPLRRGEQMRASVVRGCLFSILAIVSLSEVAEAQRVHDIRLEANPEKETYRFTPPLITARPGDVLLFRACKGVPHSIVFEGAGLTEAAHEALNGAMTRRAGDLTSPMLTAEGGEFRMVVPRIPPGIYHFYCLPHRAYDMRGQLRVTK